MGDKGGVNKWTDKEWEEEVRRVQKQVRKELRWELDRKEFVINQLKDRRHQLEQEAKVLFFSFIFIYVQFSHWWLCGASSLFFNSIQIFISIHSRL